MANKLPRAGKDPRRIERAIRRTPALIDATTLQKSNTVASATTIDLSYAGDPVYVTGNTTIAGIADLPRPQYQFGANKKLRFSGTPTLTNSAALALSSGSNLTMAAGDRCTATWVSAGVWRLEEFYHANGTPFGIVPIPLGGTGKSVAIQGHDALTNGFVSIAAGATTNLATATSEFVIIINNDGTTISNFGDGEDGVRRLVYIGGSYTITLNASSGPQIYLSLGVNVAGAASARDGMASLKVFSGDILEVVCDADPPTPGGNVWMITLFIRGKELWPRQYVTAASAGTLFATGPVFEFYKVTGTNAITLISHADYPIASGTTLVLVFDDALTLTHHATNLILPGGANITTAQGDVAIFKQYGETSFLFHGSIWRCVAYTRANGTAIVPPTNVTGSSGSCTGNAATATLAAAATALETARTINGMSFNGTTNIAAHYISFTSTSDVPSTSTTWTGIHNIITLAAGSSSGISRSSSTLTFTRTGVYAIWLTMATFNTNDFLGLRLRRTNNTATTLVKGGGYATGLSQTSPATIHGIFTVGATDDAIDVQYARKGDGSSNTFAANTIDSEAMATFNCFILQIG